MYPYKLWFHRPLTIQKYESPKSQNRLFFFKKIYHKTIDTEKQNRCSTIPAGWNLDLNKCACNDKTLSANWQVGNTVYVPIELYSF